MRSLQTKYLFISGAIISVFFLILYFGVLKSTPDHKLTQIKIGVSLYRQDDTFISSVRKYIEEAAKSAETEDNIKIIVNVMDAKGNQGIQNDHIDIFISQDYNIICVNEVDRTAASHIIDKAKSANIPIVFFNREPVEEDLQRWNKVYYIGSDPKEAGIMQGEIAIKEYMSNRERVDRNGDRKLQYVMLEGEPGHQDATVRTEYSIKTITSKNITVEKLASGTANWQRSEAFAIMSQWIDLYGYQIEMVFCNNDDMALGAIDAYKAKKISDMPFIIGMDGTDIAKEALKEGTLSATVYNDGKSQGYAIFETAYALALGQDPKEKVNFTGNYAWFPHKILYAEDVMEAWDEDAVEE